MNLDKIKNKNFEELRIFIEIVEIQHFVKLSREQIHVPILKTNSGKFNFITL